MDMIRCKKCDHSNVKELDYSDTVDFRGLELDVSHLLEWQCQECFYCWETDEQRLRNNEIIQKEYRTICGNIRYLQHMLTGKEIEDIRTRLNLDHLQAAQLVGVLTNEFKQYETEERLQTVAMDRLLRLVDLMGLPAIDFLKNIKNELH